MIYWADSLAKNDGQDQMKKAGALINELTGLSRKWGFLAVVKAPLQTDTNNGGVFVCMFARMLIEGRLLNTYAELTMKQPTAKDLESERALIARELAKA
jgi:Ulp1 family protease